MLILLLNQLLRFFYILMSPLSYCPCSVITKDAKEALANMQAYREKYGI